MWSRISYACTRIILLNVDQIILNINKEIILVVHETNRHEFTAADCLQTRWKREFFIFSNCKIFCNVFTKLLMHVCTLNRVQLKKSLDFRTLTFPQYLEIHCVQYNLKISLCKTKSYDLVKNALHLTYHYAITDQNSYNHVIKCSIFNIHVSTYAAP